MNLDIEKNIKNKLQNFKASAPEGSWSIIEAGINTRRKKRGMFWIATFAGLAFAVLGLSLFISRYNDDLKNENPASLFNPPQNNKEAINMADQIKHEVKTDKLQRHLVNEKISLPPNDVKAEHQVVSNQNINRQIVNNKTAITNKRDLISESNSPSLNTTNSAISSMAPAPVEPKVNLYQNENTSKESPELTLNNQVENRINSINKFQYSNNRNAVFIEPLASDDFQELIVPTISLSDKIKNRMESPCLFGKGKDCYNFKNKKGSSTFYAELLFGPDIVNRTLIAKNLDTDLLAIRNESELVELSWSAALRGSVVMNNGFALKTGLLFSQVHEQFNYQGRETRSRSFVDNGMTRTVVETGTVTRTIFNTLRTLDIPLLVGYEIDMGRFILALNTGGALNLSFSQEGQIFASSNNPATIGSQDPDSIDIFKSNAGMSLLGNIGMYYKIKDNLQIMVEPNIRYRLGSVTKDSYSLEQKYLTTGLHLGLRIRL